MAPLIVDADTADTISVGESVYNIALDQIVSDLPRARNRKRHAIHISLQSHCVAQNLAMGDHPAPAAHAARAIVADGHLLQIEPGLRRIDNISQQP